MIDMAMYAALGFLVASLLALILAAPLWRRAVRLTSRRIEATLPMSVTDIQADKDQLRAEYAIALRRVEVALDKAKDKAARELVHANKRKVEISVLNEELAGAKAKLEENANANRVLEQTIKRRLPDLEARIKAAKEAIAELESTNRELRSTVTSQASALKEARALVQTQRGEVEELRTSIEGGGGPLVRRLAKSDPELAKENQRINVELSRLKEEVARQKANTEENVALRRELDRLAKQLLAAAIPQAEVEAVVMAASFVREEPAFMPQVEESEQVEQEPAPQEPELETAPEESSPAPAPQEAELEGAPYGANGGGNGAEASAPETTPQPEPEPETEPETQSAAESATESEPRGSIAKRFAARRARRQAAKGRGRSLTERLKDIPADAPET
jgi:hypothetical protein